MREQEPSRSPSAGALAAILVALSAVDGAQGLQTPDPWTPGTCGPCEWTGGCPPTLPVGPESNHACEDWSGADLTATYLPYSDFSNANLHGADLHLAVFNEGKLNGADLTSANMHSTRFYLSDLTGARLDGAEVTSTIFIGAQLDHATGLDATTGVAVYDICTDFTGTGFDPQEAGWFCFPQVLPLEACETELTISIGLGGKQRLHLDAGPESAGRLYWVLGSASGTTPGIASIPPIPLNVDAYMEFTIQLPGTFIQGGVGYLNERGRAQARIELGPNELGPHLLDVQLHHAFLLLDEQLVFSGASNAVPLRFVP
jgi:hypothetical protein